MHDPEDTPEYRQRVIEFLQAPTYQAQRELVEQWPELLTDLTDQQLTMLIDAVVDNGDERSEGTLRSARDMLRRCRDVGIAQAFDEAIRAATPDPDGEISELLMTAMEHRWRFNEEGDPDDLDEALNLLHAVLEHPSLAGEHPGARDVALLESARAHLDRFELTDDVADTTAAITILETVRAEMGPAAPADAAVYDELAIAYFMRYSATSEPDDLEASIGWSERAIAAEPMNSDDVRPFRVHLAMALMARHEHTESADDIDRAVDMFQAAVDSAEPGSDERDRIERLLGQALYQRFEERGDPEDEERLHSLVRASLEAEAAAEAEGAADADLDVDINELGLEAETAIVCPTCGIQFEVSLPIVVLADQQPELIDAIIVESIHEVACPSCGSGGWADFPLLVDLGDEDRTVLYSPSSDVDDEQQQQEYEFLALRLMAVRMVDWDGDVSPESLVGDVLVVPRSELGDEISTYLNRSHDTGADVVQQVAGDMGPVDPALLDLVVRFVQASSWAESKLLCLDNPELVNDDAVAILDGLATVHDENSDSDVLDMLVEHRDLLAACVAHGVEEAFAGKRDVSSGAPELQDELAALKQAELAGDWNGCVTLARAVLAGIDRSSDPEMWAAITGNLAAWLVDADGPRRAAHLEALGLLDEAAEVYTREAYPEEWGLLQVSASNMHRGLHEDDPTTDLGPAVERAEAALTVARTEDSPDLRSRALTALAQARLLRRGPRDEEDALAALREVADLRQPEFFDEWREAQLNVVAGLLSAAAGNRRVAVREAVERAGRALRHAERLGRRDAVLMKVLAVATGDAAHGGRPGSIEEAIELLDRACEIFSDDGREVDRAGCLVNLSNLYLRRARGERLANFERAIGDLEEAAEVYDRHDMAGDLAMVSLNLSSAYMNRPHGDPETNLRTAVGHAALALGYYDRETTPADWATARVNLGAACLKLGPVGKAQAVVNLEAALEVFTPEAFPHEWATAHNDLALAHALDGGPDDPPDFEQAIAHDHQALDAWTRESAAYHWAQAMDNLGDFHHRRSASDDKRDDDLAQAAIHYTRALEVYTVDRFAGERIETLTALGDIRFEQREWERALAVYDLVREAGEVLLLESITGPGRQSQLATTHRPSLRSAFCLARLGRIGDGLVRAEQGRARQLADNLAIDDAMLLGLPDETRSAIEAHRVDLRELEARARDDAANNEVLDDQLTESLDEARRQLRSLLNDLESAGLGTGSRSLGLDELLALAPPGGALVVPIVSDEGSVAIIVPSGTTEPAFENLLRLDELTQADIGRLLRTDVGTEDDIGNRLWTLLIGPVRDRLRLLGVRPGSDVWIMPTSGLGMLPLHAAWMETDDGRRYLIDEYTVTYVASGFTQHICRARVRERAGEETRLLVVADPTSDLPFSALEGERVAAVATNGLLLTGLEADAAAVLTSAPDHTHVHLACHGSHDWDDPLRSRLQLAADTSLTLHQILADLDLGRTRLVTLSACETGLIDLRSAPDEMIGLPAGFLQAGAPAVISTLWPVADLSTMFLVERFFERLLGDGLTPAAALRDAQMWLRDATTTDLRNRFPAGAGDLFDELMAASETDSSPSTDTTRPFRNPFHWAPFVVSGV